MVFQTYAIWPHMNVFNNVAYPLQTQKMPRDMIRKRVEETLHFVQLEGFEKRPAAKLSGGQQQRVALARALVAQPKVILLMNPFQIWMQSSGKKPARICVRFLRILKSQRSTSPMIGLKPWPSLILYQS